VINTVLVRLFKRRTSEGVASSQPESTVFRSPA
jgi:hypothetical protein